MKISIAIFSASMIVSSSSVIAATQPPTAFSFQAVVELEEVTQTCFFGDCGGEDSEGPSVGDLLSLTFSLEIEGTETEIIATGLNPVIGSDKAGAGLFEADYDFLPNEIIISAEIFENLGEGFEQRTFAEFDIDYVDFETPVTAEDFGDILDGGDFYWELDESFNEVIFYSEVAEGNIIAIDAWLASEQDGSSEQTPLLPVNTVDPENPEFLFAILAEDILEGEPIWIDPPAAAGFEYEVFSGEIAEIIAPSLDMVPDPDGYEIIVSGQSYLLAPGELLDLISEGLFGVTEFTLLGIDPTLMLDPSDPTVFPLGLKIVNSDMDSNVFVSQSPIVAPIPLPAAFGLLLCSAMALIGVGRASTKT